MLKVAIMMYRDWAYPVIHAIEKHPNVKSVEVFRSDTHFQDSMSSRTPDRYPDLVLYVGWSSPPLPEWVERIPHFGVHCAENDVYSGGTPLQNQIIDGVKRTKHRLFQVGIPELTLRKWSHQVDLDLSGNMDDILRQMTSTSISLFNQFLNDYPDNVVWKTWPAADPADIRHKRTPEDSILLKKNISLMSTRELYDFFRALEEPYPNGCIEDEHGYLIIERVRFKTKC